MSSGSTRLAPDDGPDAVRIPGKTITLLPAGTVLPPGARLSASGGKSTLGKVGTAVKAVGISAFALIIGIAALPSLLRGDGALTTASNALGLPQFLKDMLWPALIVVGVLFLVGFIKSQPPPHAYRY